MKGMSLKLPRLYPPITCTSLSSSGMHAFNMTIKTLHLKSKAYIETLKTILQHALKLKKMMALGTIFYR